MGVAGSAIGRRRGGIEERAVVRLAEHLPADRGQDVVGVVVPEQEPVMMGSSGKEPLDRAAASSIRASTPFEPLPSAFSGPYIELRFIFLYNIPLNSQTAQ